MPIYQGGGRGGPYTGQSDVQSTGGYGRPTPQYRRTSQSVQVSSPIFVRQATGWSVNTSADTEQVTSPTLNISPADGDLVLVAITVDKAASGLGAATIVPDSGTWTQVGPISDSGSPNDHRATWLWRIWHTGDATALTFTCSAAVEWAVTAMAYAGCSLTTPVGSYASGWETGTSTAAHATSTITPGSSLPWVGVSYGDRSGSTWAAPTGYTTRANAHPIGGTGINPSTSIHDSNGLVRKLPVSLTNVTTGAVASSTAVWFIFELVPYGQTSNPPPQIVMGPWIGNVSSSGATMTYAFSGLATTARLKVSTASDLLTSPVFGSAVAAGTQGLAKLSITGLSADTLYYFGVEADGVLNSEGFGSFRTDPTPGVATSYSIAFGSCQFTILSTGTFEQIRQKVGSAGAGAAKARRLIHMGDIHYEDWGASDTLQNIYDQWFLTLNQPLFAPMLAELPMTYQWDNHDWGGTESNKNNVRAADVAAAYRSVVPHYTLPATDGRGTWQSWVIGRVRYIQIDPRSQRVPITDPESSSKTMLGTEQKAWFKSELQQSEPLKIVCGNMYWRSEGGASGDRWSSYSTEWAELTAFMTGTAGVTGKVFVIFGDTHALVADDGSTAVTGGIPQAGGAPFQQGSLDIPEVWSAGSYDIYPDVMEAFGWLDIVDNGTTITVDYKGITSDDGVTRVSMTQVFSSTTAGAATIAGAGSVTATGTQVVRATAALTGAGAVTAAANTAKASSTLVDDFNDGSFDLVKFPNSYGSITETGGKAQIPCTTSYAGVASSATYLFDRVALPLFPPAQAGATTECYMALFVQSAAQNTAVPGTDIGVTINRIDGTINFINWAGFADAGIVTLTYDPTAHAWLRLRRSGGDLLWETAPDGTTWTTRRTLSSPPAWLFNVDLQIFVECHRSDGTSNVGEIDNFNIAAATVGGAATVAGVGATSAVVVQRAAASVAGTGAVTAATVQRAQASLAGVGAVSASVVQRGSATVAGVGAATANAAGTTSGAATVAGTGAVTAGVVQSATAAAAGVGATVAVTVARAGATVAGAGAVTATTVQAATSTVAGVGAVVAGAQGTTTGSATVAGAGAVTAAARLTLRAPATVAGAGTTTGTASIRGAATAAGVGATTALVTLRGTAAIAGTGTVVGSVGQTLTATATVAGAGSVTAVGATRFTARPYTGSTTRPGSGTTVRPFAGTTVRP